MEFVSKIIYNKRRKRYTVANQSLFDRFWKDEKKSERWRGKLLSKTVKEKSKLKRHFELFVASVGGLVPVDFKREAVDQLIDLFTKKDMTDEAVDQRIAYYNRNGIFANGKRVDREALVFEMDGKKIVVRTLTSASPGLAQVFPALLTSERNCKCHEGSINLASILGEDSQIVTGSYYILSPKSTVLHSVVEKEIDGEIYVLDYDSNTLWERDDFYQFFHFQPFEKISQKTIKKDTDDLLFLMGKDNDYCKLYLTNRDEAIALSKKLQAQAKQDENI